MKKLFFIWSIFLSMMLNADGFKSLDKYDLDDFNFAWKINSIELLSFSTTSIEDEKGGILEVLPSPVSFKTILKSSNIKHTKKREANLQWFAKYFYKKDNYFWKTKPFVPLQTELFYILVFDLKNDKRLQAITELKDIKDMLGDIDTKAELALWIYATLGETGFKKVKDVRKSKNLYLVTFEYTEPYTCMHKKFIKFYDKNGYVRSEEKLEDYLVKDCHKAMPF